MKSKWIILKILLGIIVLGFLVSFSVNRHISKNVEKINIKIDHDTGRYFLNDSLVLSIISSQKNDINELSIGDLAIGEIETKLNENTYVNEAQVYKDIDGELFIVIRQQVPIARVFTGNDEYYLTSNLTKMPLSNLYSDEVILVGGEIEENDYDGIYKMTEFLEADKLLKKHIIAMKKVNPNSFILLVNNGDYYIEFGELENIEDKFENLKLFYDQYLGKVGLDYYKSINLKFNNQIVATKRKGDEQ